MCHHNPRAAIAVEAPDDAQATAGVTVDFTDVGAKGVPVLDAVVPAEILLVHIEHNDRQERNAAPVPNR